MSKILFLTDSLALPREIPERVYLEETWPALLRSQLTYHDFWQASVNGATTTDLTELLGYYLTAKTPFDHIVVQVGIVDCAPRAFRKGEHCAQTLARVLTKLLPGFGKFIFESVRRLRQVSYVSHREFQENVLSIRSVCEMNKAHLTWISIAGKQGYETVLPGIFSRIEQYNEILSEALDRCLLDISDIPDSHFMDDFHHLNTKGHHYLFSRLSKRLAR